MAIAKAAPTAHNDVYMVGTFVGQLFGTAVRNLLHTSIRWAWSRALNIAQLGVALLCLASRGPHKKLWIGWRGGGLRSSQGQDDGETTSGGP